MDQKDLLVIVEGRDDKMAGLQSGEELPVVNGCQLAITATQRGRQRAKAQLSIQTRVGA